VCGDGGQGGHREPGQGTDQPDPGGDKGDRPGDQGNRGRGGTEWPGTHDHGDRGGQDSVPGGLYQSLLLFIFYQSSIYSPTSFETCVLPLPYKYNIHQFLPFSKITSSFSK